MRWPGETEALKSTMPSSTAWMTISHIRRSGTMNLKILSKLLVKKGWGTAQPTREGKRDLSIPGWTVLHGKSVSFFREGDITLGWQRWCRRRKKVSFFVSPLPKNRVSPLLRFFWKWVYGRGMAPIFHCAPCWFCRCDAWKWMGPHHRSCVEVFKMYKQSKNHYPDSSGPIQSWSMAVFLPHPSSRFLPASKIINHVMYKGLLAMYLVEKVGDRPRFTYMFTCLQL